MCFGEEFRSENSNDLAENVSKRVLMTHNWKSMFLRVVNEENHFKGNPRSLGPRRKLWGIKVMEGEIDQEVGRESVDATLSHAFMLLFGLVDIDADEVDEVVTIEEIEEVIEDDVAICVIGV